MILASHGAVFFHRVYTQFMMTCYYPVTSSMICRISRDVSFTSKTYLILILIANSSCSVVSQPLGKSICNWDKYYSSSGRQ